MLSQFRIAAGRSPADPRFEELAAALAEASPQFRDCSDTCRERIASLLPEGAG